jgi:hypothetical protein
MVRSGEPVLVIRQGSTNKIHSAVRSDSASPASPCHTGPYLLGGRASTLWALFIGALDVFLVRGVNADDVAAVDKDWDLYY